MNRRMLAIMVALVSTLWFEAACVRKSETPDNANPTVPAPVNPGGGPAAGTSDQTSGSNAGEMTRENPAVPHSGSTGPVEQHGKTDSPSNSKHSQ